MLKSKSSSIETAEVFRFSFDRPPGGWACFTICEQTGEFSLQSDWGNGSYRWNIGALGAPSLKDFLADTSPDYVLSKFSYENKELKERFDADKTRKEMRKHLCEERRRLSLKQDEARELWEQVEGFYDEANSSGDLLAVERMEKELNDFFGGEPWNYFRHAPSPQYRFLYDELLPFFFDVLRDLGYGPRNAKKAG